MEDPSSTLNLYNYEHVVNHNRAFTNIFQNNVYISFISTKLYVWPDLQILGSEIGDER